VTKKWNASLSISDIEVACTAAMNDFGKPDVAYWPPPHYALRNTIPWSAYITLSPREECFAGLHCLLYKIGVCKDTDNNKWTERVARSRLEAVDWAKSVQGYNLFEGI